MKFIELRTRTKLFKAGWIGNNPYFGWQIFRGSKQFTFSIWYIKGFLRWT